MSTITKALVTGSAGVIGRQLTTMLMSQGVSVLGIDREVMPDGDWDGLEFVQGDLSEMDLSAIGTFAPDAVFHLAASFERSEESNEYWDIGWRDDVVASHRVIDAAAACDAVKTFIFASSYLVYDPELYLIASSDSDPVSLQEDTPVAPRNLCGAGKYYTERELAYMQATRRPDLRVASARIFRVFGRGSRDVISRWIAAGLDGEGISVYNRTNRFDYILADDVAEALLRLGMDDGAEGAYNVGTGTCSPITDVLAILGDLGLLDPANETDTGEGAPFEASLANVGRLGDQLGWTPPTSLRDGIELVANYQRELRGNS